MGFFNRFCIGSVNSRPVCHTTLAHYDRSYAVRNLKVHDGVKLSDIIPRLLER